MSDDHTLTFTRHIKASPETVWRCWTDPALITQWFTPVPVRTTEAEMDARPGGTFRVVMEIPDHGTMAGDAGCVLVADPARRLVWTNALGPGFRPNAIGTGPGEFPFTAEILMAPEDGGCRYTATVWHARAEDSAAHAQMGFYDGWGAATTQLEALAQTL